MPTTSRPTRHVQKEMRPPTRAEATPQKKAGRPQGAPSTIVNLRLPLDLLAQLDRYIDRLEGQTGLKANRGMIARRALVLFLETRATETSTLALEGTPHESLGTRPSVVP